MLVSLHVKNLALIDETEVYFKEGLNILSGETGAGKSIIIGSINLALGKRADKDLIRSGEQYALVELIFSVKEEDKKAKLKDLDIFLEDDEFVIIQRRIMPNRSISKICGETVTTKILKEVADILITIHGQQENHTLLDRRNHRDLLDSFCMEQLQEPFAELAKAYKNYTRLKSEYDDLCSEGNGKEKEIALATFEWEEIENAKLTIGEDISLEQTYQRLSNSKKIQEVLSLCVNATSNEDGASELIGRASRECHSIAQFDTGLQEISDQIEQLDDLLNDWNRSAKRYLEDIACDDETLFEVEERLNSLNHLKSKYGPNIKDVLTYQEKQKELIDKYEDLEGYKSSLENQLSKSLEIIHTNCSVVHAIREDNAIILENKIQKELEDLNFLSVQFKIQFETSTKFNAKGNDEVAFYISMNPGEPLKSLETIASGGELSRIMLALKTVMAQKDEVSTLIFDEIDAGISGKTAWKVSEKLGTLSNSNQIICITHLPQIAAMADSHFIIEKSSYNNSTTTNIHPLMDEESIGEIARLLGGDHITQTVIANAKELKELAKKTKLY